MVECACGDDWRVESADLRTGIVRTMLHPLSFDWQTELNRVGKGSMTLSTQTTRIRDVWPHLSSIFIVRIDRVTGQEHCEFGGYVEKVSASDGGTTSVGLVSIEDYLHHRMIRDTITYTGVSQNAIAASLVNRCGGAGGIPINGLADTTRFVRDRTYNSWDRKFIGSAIEELCDVLAGPDWVTTHNKVGGLWKSTLTFRDYLGTDQNILFRSDRETNGYALDVDAKEHATWVDAMGSGEEEDTLVATASDLDVYPRFDAAPAFKDVKRFGTLTDHAEGYLHQYRDPSAVPSVSLNGLRIDPALHGLGDTVTVDNSFGAVTYKGKARVVSVSWKVGTDGTERTLDFVPLTRAVDSVLNQVPDEQCEPC